MKIKRIIGCIVTIFLTIGLLGYMTKLTERKSSIEKYMDFFDQEENFDVLFIGSSHVINGIYPMELWNDYGIISYNWGGHGNQLATSYWVMKNAMEYTKPKLMVIDCLSLSMNIKGSNNVSYLHLSFDAFPLSLTKIKSVIDILDDPVLDEKIKNGLAKEEGNEPRTRIGLLWDYSVYHSRWNVLTKNDLQPSASKEKGAELRIAVTPGKLNKISSDSKLEKETIALNYLKKMIEQCQQEGVDVLLIYLPFPAEEGQQKEANLVYDIAEQYRVNYINFLDKDIIDYAVDCYDSDSHLNPSGARKVTDYLGKYIIENYNVIDQRNNEAYYNWYADYVDYEFYKLEALKEQESLDNYLMLIRDKCYDAIIEVNNKDIWKSDLYVNLLKNLGVEQENISDDTDFLVIKQGEIAQCYENFHISGNEESSSIGTISLVVNEAGNYHNGVTGYYNVFLNGAELYTVDSEQNEDVDIRITLLDSKTLKIVDRVAFDIKIAKRDREYIISTLEVFR